MPQLVPSRDKKQPPSLLHGLHEVPEKSSQLRHHRGIWESRVLVWPSSGYEVRRDLCLSTGVHYNQSTQRNRDSGRCKVYFRSLSNAATIDVANKKVL